MAKREIVTFNEAGKQFVAPQAGDTAILPITLNAATGDEVAYDLQFTTNKATSGNDVGLRINQTDTASPGTSLLVEAQAGGVSHFTLDNEGNINKGLGGSRLTVSKTSDSFSLALKVAADNQATMQFKRYGLSSIRRGVLMQSLVLTQNTISLTSASNGTTGLLCEADYEMSQLYSTNPQTFRIYNTFTDTSNYERASFSWNANAFEIGTNALGTGTQRHTSLVDTKIMMPNLPVADPALTGQLWNNAGVLTVSAG